MHRHILPILTAIGVLAATAADAANVVIVIDGIEPGRGIVNVAFCNGGALDQCRQFGAEQPAGAETLGFRFKDVPAGKYAFVGFQDFDSSGDNERNMIGMPKEPFVVGVGAGAKLMPPPTYESIAVPVIEGVDNVFRLTLRTIKGTTKQPGAPIIPVEAVPLMDVPSAVTVGGGKFVPAR